MFPGNSWHQTRRFARELDQAAMPYIAAIKAKFTDEEIAEMERARCAAMTVSIIAIGGYIAVAAAVIGDQALLILTIAAGHRSHNECFRHPQSIAAASIGSFAQQIALASTAAETPDRRRLLALLQIQNKRRPHQPGGAAAPRRVSMTILSN